MKKPAVKFISLLLAALMILGLFSGVLVMLGSAAQDVIVTSAGLSKPLTVGKRTNDLKVTVSFKDPGFNIDDRTYAASEFEIQSSLFEYSSNTKLKIDKQGTDYYADLTNVNYNGDSGRNLTITVASQNITIKATIPSDYFSTGSSGDTTTAKVITADTTVSRTLTVGKVTTGVTVTFNLLEPDYLDEEYLSDRLFMPLDSSFGWSYNTKLTITSKFKNKVPYYEAKLTNVSYNGGSSKTLYLTLDDDIDISVPIPNKYFNDSGETDGTPVSDIVVQSTIVRDATGKKLSSIDKDSGLFTVEVTFYDIGLKNESAASIDAAKKNVFITTPTGFKLHSGSAGIIERIKTDAEYPRFKATFERVESTGSANTLNFRVQYDFEEYEKGIKGEAVATLFQINTESSSSEDEETAPLKPNIIVQAYSYGNDAIVAGGEFDLNVTFTNTSKTVAVENVVMTIEPANGFLIAAASNTMYFPTMSAGESKPYAVALRALPSQNTTGAAGVVTDYSVTIKFSYQYLSKKEYAAGETTTKIAIPVEQLDRFSVDEITDYSAYLSVGYEGYITVPITNKGKSATMNITGTVLSESGAEFTAPPIHYGNLEAGKTGTVNISIMVNTPGEFLGDVVISYEDENMNQKEIRQPIAIMVEQPMMPQPEMPVNPEAEPQNKVSTFTIVMCGLGGLMLASPAAMILMKRIKSRGNEDIDEDF